MKTEFERHLETAAELGRTKAHLSLAQAEIGRLRLRIALAEEAAGLMGQVFEQLDEESHGMARIAYEAQCLAQGYRFEREEAA